MSDRFLSCVDFFELPANDGQGFHVTPGDEGGATNEGITIPALSQELGRPATVADLRAMTVDQRNGVLRRIWDAAQCGEFPPGVDLMMADFAWNGGDGAEIIVLQRAAGVVDDGRLGPVTLRAVHAMDTPTLIAALNAWQAAYYRACSTFPRFGKGWLDRTARRAVAAATAYAHTLEGATT